MLLGFGGALTFKNARRAVEAVAALSLENIVLETDCPYMRRNRSGEKNAIRA